MCCVCFVAQGLGVGMEGVLAGLALEGACTCGQEASGGQGERQEKAEPGRPSTPAWLLRPVTRSVLLRAVARAPIACPLSAPLSPAPAEELKKTAGSPGW